MTGMKSPFGQRESILNRYHWTIDYLLWGIPWITVQKMMLDAASYETDEEDKKDKKVVVDHDTTTKILMAKYLKNKIDDIPR